MSMFASSSSFMDPRERMRHAKLAMMQDEDEEDRVRKDTRRKSRRSDGEAGPSTPYASTVSGSEISLVAISSPSHHSRVQHHLTPRHTLSRPPNPPLQSYVDPHLLSWMSTFRLAISQNHPPAVKDQEELHGATVESGSLTLTSPLLIHALYHRPGYLYEQIQYRHLRAAHLGLPRRLYPIFTCKWRPSYNHTLLLYPYYQHLPARARLAPRRPPKLAQAPAPARIDCHYRLSTRQTPLISRLAFSASRIDHPLPLRPTLLPTVAAVVAVVAAGTTDRQYQSKTTSPLRLNR